MKRRLRQWGLSIALISIVLIAAVLVIVHWASGASDGAVHVGKPDATTTGAPQGPVISETPYFTTQLPQGYDVKQRSVTPGQAAIQLQLRAYNSHVASEQFAVTVGILPQEGLNGVGDYHLRTSDPGYAHYLPLDMPASAVAFRTTTEPAAFTVFWVHDTDYYEITLSTDDVGLGYAPLQSTYSQVMTHWKWL